jgi:hypothetical protein
MVLGSGKNLFRILYIGGVHIGARALLANNIIYMVWINRSPITVGKRGGILLV